MLPSAVGLLLAVIPTLLGGLPTPQVHDEWGYLLAGETFAAGRLTNPPHAHWRHFETIHQLQRPTYQSKYPPGEGAFLAIGFWLGHPIYGVWISVVLMVASCTWMLQAWTSRRWALLGGFVVALQLVVVGRAYGGGASGYWSQSYWGGAVAATGGALLFGATRRLLSVTCMTNALLLGAGATLLSVSRPKEGVIAMLPSVVLIVVAIWRRGPDGRVARYVRTIAPNVLLLLVVVVGLGQYHAAVTGKATRMPWLEHYEQYIVFPAWVWGEPREDVEWNNRQLEEFHGGWERELHSRHNTTAGFLRVTANKLARMWLFFIGPIFTVSLLMLPWMMRDRWMLFVLGCIALLLVNHVATIAAFPHYSAPLACLLILLVTRGLRRLRTVRVRGIRIGRPLFAAVMFAAAIQAVVWVALATWELSDHRSTRRSRIEAQLLEMDGRDLVFVRYEDDHDVHDEWVFNHADIDNSEVVWARELDPPSNRALRHYFAARVAWQITVGRHVESRLTPLLTRPR